MLPLIAGPPVPKPPRDPPQPDDAQWIKQADTWAASVLVYLVPWDLERGIPNWPLSWQGLEEWCTSLDPSSLLHRGRWQMARNLATSAMNDASSKNVAFRHRRRTAHTYAQFEAMRQDPQVRRQMDAADAQRFQTGVDPDCAVGSGGPHQEDGPIPEAARRVIDLLQERFARFGDGQVSNQVLVQRQRDEQTVANLARLLAPDVSAPNAFDDLSGLSSQSDDADRSDRLEPADSWLPLASNSVGSFAVRTTADAMQTSYDKAKRARPSTPDAPDDAARGLGHTPRPFPVEGDLEHQAPPVSSLSSDQQASFDKIMAKYSRGEQLLEIVHGMPGTGKTVPLTGPSSRTKLLGACTITSRSIWL
jgi:hypothetical protein